MKKNTEKLERKGKLVKQKEFRELFKECNRLSDKENRLHILIYLTVKRLGIAKETLETNVGAFEKKVEITEKFNQFKRKIKGKKNYIDQLEEKTREDWNEREREWRTWSAEVCRSFSLPLCVFSEETCTSRCENKT